MTPLRTTPLPTRVLCVDDNRDMNQVMQMLIDAEPLMRCVGCLNSADRLVEEVRMLSKAAGLQPLVILLDATMPGKDPLVAMAELRAEFPCVRTIIYSGYDDAEFLDRAAAAGAYCCVSKRDDPELVLGAVRKAANAS